MKETKDFRVYFLTIDRKSYKIVARSKKEAINTARFKYCYLQCLQRYGFYSVVDRNVLRRMIKNFNLANITKCVEGEIVQHGQLSMDKRFVKSQWNQLKRFEKEQLLEDARRHELEMEVFE